MNVFLLSTYVLIENPDLNGSVATRFVVDVKRVVGHPTTPEGGLLGSVCKLGQKLTDRDCITLRRRPHLEPS